MIREMKIMFFTIYYISGIMTCGLVGVNDRSVDKRHSVSREITVTRPKTAISNTGCGRVTGIIFRLMAMFMDKLMSY